MLLVASARAGQWVLLPVDRSGRVSAAEVEGVDHVAGWETEPLASAPMGDGRQVVLTVSSGRCLVLSGVDEFDRQCLYPPPSRPRLATGPVVQKAAGAPIEVYGTADAVVERVVVSYALGGGPAAQDAVLLRTRKGAPLARRMAIARPFAVFLAELPATARNPIATAYDSAGRVVGRDGYARIHPHVFLGTAGPDDLPDYGAAPWAHVDVAVVPAVGDGSTRDFTVAFTSLKRPRRSHLERWHYVVKAATTTPGAGCVNARDRVAAPPPVGRRLVTALRLADGEGGDTRWCAGRYRGRVVMVGGGVRAVVARFGFRVLP